MIKKLVLTSLIFSYSHVSLAFGGCTESNSSAQSVYAYEGNRRLDKWFVGDDIHTLTMSNEFPIGIKIEKVSDDFYQQRFSKEEYVPELVGIFLYDMRSEKPALLTRTYGPASSVQGYSNTGGADKVDELGSPGLTLHLYKNECYKVSTM